MTKNQNDTEIKKTQATLSKQLEFERLIADIAAKLAQVGPENLEKQLDETLQSLGRFIQTERAFLARFSEDGKILKHTNYWTAKGSDWPDMLNELDIAAEVPWVAQQIRKGAMIKVGPDLSGLPDEARELTQYLRGVGVNSGVVVPIRVENEAIGLVGLDTTNKARDYPASLLDRLKIIADIIGSTIQRIDHQGIQQEYQNIVEATTSAIGLVNRHYVYQYVNETYCSAFGKKRQEIMGSTVADLFGTEIFDQELKPHYKRCFGGEEISFQSWADFPGWGHRFMDVRYSPHYGSDRKVTAVVVSAHDITEIKQLENKLKESEEKFRAFMENIPASIYIKDDNDVHIYANPQAFKSTRKKPDELIGMTSRDIWPPDVADRLIALDRQVLDENVPRITEEWQGTANGDNSWRRDIKFPIQLASGEKLLGGIAIDITETKLNEEKLSKAFAEIEELTKKLEQENIQLREEIELHHPHVEIIGKSKPVLKMLSKAEQVAETSSTILLLGETGTGKELIANEIHRLSSRKERTMVKVNCAALPSTLIESELFGREKGAYTGAMSRQVGRFEIADGSTLFLDEIGDLPLELQTKLLRVLQDGQFERLGNPAPIAVDVRIIASTNRDLAMLVSDGTFREDLFYRLNVFPIIVPPLRDRLEDIPLLVWHFVREFESSMGKNIEKITQKSIKLLKEYEWPGNIRELKNLVENAMIISKGKLLRIYPPIKSPSIRPKIIKLEDVTRNHIKDVLRETTWRVRGPRGAAEQLGLKPTTLEAKMKKLGISRPQ